VTFLQVVKKVSVWN